jgi:Domain of unknown function (DUF4398)
MLRFTLISTAVAASVLVGGCAVEGPQPTAQLASARTLVAEADKSQAQRYAAADLQRAHDELSEAETANSQRHFNEARSYAESAAVDADLATARSQAGDADRAAREIEQSNATLRQESRRAAAASDAPPAPPPPPNPPDMQSYPAAPAAPATPPDDSASPH